VNSIGERLVEALKRGLYKLWEEEEAHHVRKEGVYYPSAIGSCLRKQYYMYTVERKPSSEKLAVFATGKGVHKAVAEALSVSGVVKVESEEVETRLSVSKDVQLKGRIDILVVEVNGERVVVEVKSTSRLPENPHENHLLQLQTYLHAAGLKRGILLYWDKRTGRVKTFEVEKDEKYLAKVAERAIVLHEHLKRGTPPLKEAVLENRLWECDLCEFYDICNPFLLDVVPEGEEIVIASLDGFLVDDSERRKRALRLSGLSEGVNPYEIRGALRATYLKNYFDPASYPLDRPNPNAIKSIWGYRKHGRYIVLLSERPSEYRDEVERELKKIGIPYDVLLLRPEDEAITRWKLSTIKRLSSSYKIYICIESDPKMVERIERLGIKILKPDT